MPFGQDDPDRKPCSLMADFTLIGETVRAALEGRQLQPLLRTERIRQAAELSAACFHFVNRCFPIVPEGLQVGQDFPSSLWYADLSKRKGRMVRERE